MREKWVLCVSLALFGVVTAGAPAAAPAQAPIGATAATPDTVSAVLDQYCVTCHNERLQTAELALDGLDLSDVSADAETWEAVVRKLRLRVMPPTGRPRPDDATNDAVASWFETALDSAAAADPNPGRRPALHRLSRTEYQNAVRDLLALDDLPKELDIEVMLPADNATSGFDNLADLLFVSPTLMERYLGAARRISRLAVGDPTMLPIVDTYRIDRDLVQDRHVEGLPLGTRGGTRVRSHLPLDGEYLITVVFPGAAREPHEVEVSVDGERVGLFTIGENPPERPASGVFTFDADPDVQVRVSLRAGPREVAVAFLPKSGAVSGGLVRSARSRSRQPSIASLIVSGPYGADGAGDTPSRRHIFSCRPGTGAAVGDEQACAREILSTTARRAYRRPVTGQDLERLLPFYEQGRAEGGFERGVQRAIERVLVSPEFLFRVERDPAGVAAGDVYRVTDLELASRLSFFLWASIPDDELLDLASRGELGAPGVLDQQVQRMLADPRSEALVTNFAEQWLYLRDIELKEPDTGFFPDFDENLRQAFRRETELFIDSILRDDRSVLDLLTASHTFVNERLAKHYGIPNVYGSHFRRVELEDEARRGLLGQGSILTLTSYGTRTSPVLRGKWILENLLSSPPPPPPPNVPALEATTGDGVPRSMREAMEQHRANPVCASCHSKMDPLGFALENFDAVGRWRSLGETNLPIDATGQLPNGEQFEGPAGLRAALLRSPDQFVITITDKLLTYALGRGVEAFDAPTVRAIVREAARDDYRFSTIVTGIVNSTPFQMRKSES
ncbi:MAG: hypothetical protein CL477_07635 [Acidobacteria bacterium]|jgi:mono/diheme cytochrome c family protein|nr:hypothetical protein [Acidobacteriota bacterium]MDP7479256.1 DUF1592 domain-containing protein [Vicinamibacterales bacterium]MDP7690604.1 DUF1592 domain-containing protein [Vicinamibacterales bacterium]HJN44918.1 DUF1592 domain-containing protein [Vicinamibacterales bacterium]